MPYGTFRRRNDVTTVPGLVPLDQEQPQVEAQRTVAPSPETLPPPVPSMRDFRTQRRQAGMNFRSNLGFANRISNVNQVDPLAADLASGGNVERSNYNATLPYIKMAEATAPVQAEYWRGKGIADVAGINAQGRIDAADVNGQWRSNAADLTGQSRERIADITGQSRESSARISGDARVQAAGTMRPLDPSEVRLNDARAQNNQSMAQVWQSRAADMGTPTSANSSPAMVPSGEQTPQPVTPQQSLLPTTTQPATRPASQQQGTPVRTGKAVNPRTGQPEKVTQYSDGRILFDDGTPYTEQ